MEPSGCLVCDDDSAPVSVKRVSGFISSMSPHLNELQVVEVYTALLKAGVLSDLHGNVKDMLSSGASLTDAVLYADSFLEEVLAPSNRNKSGKEPPTSNYEDDWNFPTEEDSTTEELVNEGGPPGEEFGDGWGDSPFDDYGDDWF